MDTSAKRLTGLKWASVAASILFAVSYVLMYMGLTGILEHKWNGPVSAFFLGVSVICLIVLSVTCRLDKDHDPLPERVGSLSGRMSIFAFVCTFLPIILLILINVLFSDETITRYSAEFTLLITIITIYMIGFPLALILTNKIPKMKIRDKRLGVGMFFFYLLCTAGLTLMGIVIGTPIHLALTMPFTNNETNSTEVVELMLSTSIWERVLVIGILAPVFEELIFRKLIIDRMIKYGQWISILISGLTFGLFHGNFQQGAFASLVGMLFASVYIRTGRIRYTIMLHMAVNLTTSIVTASLLSKIMPYYANGTPDPYSLPDEALIRILILFLWLMVLLTIAITGIILFFVKYKKIRPYRAPGEPSTGALIKTLMTSPLFWCFVIICLGRFGETYIPGIVTFIQG